MTKRKIIPFVLLVLVVSLFVSACSPRLAESPTPTSQVIELTDGLGRTIHLPAPAQKVISLAPSNTEILYAIGAGEQVIGRDDFSDFPVEAQSLPAVGGGFGDYNIEAIIDLQPDLVLAAEINTPEQVKALEDLGITVYLLANPTTLEEMYTNLELVGKLTGRTEEAGRLVESLKARVEAIDDIISKADRKPTVFYELDGSDPAAPWTAGAGTFIDALIARAGGVNITSDLTGQYMQFSIEELLVRDPEIILLGDAAYGVTPESISQRAGWNTLQAVMKDRIYPFDDNLVSRPGPRLVDGLEELARLIHPELFTE